MLPTLLSSISNAMSNQSEGTLSIEILKLLWCCFQVWPTKWYGRANVRSSRCFSGINSTTLPPIRVGICSRCYDLCSGGRHHSRSKHKVSNIKKLFPHYPSHFYFLKVIPFYINYIFQQIQFAIFIWIHSSILFGKL